MQNKNIILGITGGIAAYKSAELVRMLCAQDAKVRVIMTKNAYEFITPLTMQTVSGHTVYTEMFNQHLQTNLEHIALARFADAIIIAPASANFIAKLAHGLLMICLQLFALQQTAPIAVAPAMNKEMWNAAITQENVDDFKKTRHFCLWSGDLARKHVVKVDLAGCSNRTDYGINSRNICRTNILRQKNCYYCWPDRENIDPVRYISNYSSGKMGYALAEAA